MAGAGRTVSHGFDREGRRTELTFPDGQTFRTERDGLGRATEVRQGPLGSNSIAMAAFAYDAASRRSYFSRRFGDNSAYSYDGASRLSVLEEGFVGATGNNRSEFGFNPASQLVRESRSNDDYAWTGSVAVSIPGARAFGYPSLSSSNCTATSPFAESRTRPFSLATSPSEM